MAIPLKCLLQSSSFFRRHSGEQIKSRQNLDSVAREFSSVNQDEDWYFPGNCTEVLWAISSGPTTSPQSSGYTIIAASHATGLSYLEEGYVGSLIVGFLCIICHLDLQQLGSLLDQWTFQWEPGEFENFSLTLSYHSCWILIPAKTSPAESAWANARH